MNRTYVLKKTRSSRTQNFFIKKAKNNYLRKERISTQELRKKEKKKRGKDRIGTKEKRNQMNIEKFLTTEPAQK